VRGVKMVKEWLRSNDLTSVRSFYFPLASLQPCNWCPLFLGGFFFFLSAAQPIFETLPSRIITVMRAWRIFAIVRACLALDRIWEAKVNVCDREKRPWIKLSECRCNQRC